MMGLHRASVLISVLVFQLGLTLPVQDVSDPGKPFQLTVTPAMVNRQTAHNMTMRCSASANTPSKMSEIFRMRIVHRTKSGWEMVAEQRDVGDGPRVGDGVVTASANISGRVSDAFLQATWDSLVNDSFGVFMCDVTGFDDKYTVITESSSQMDIYERENFFEYITSLSAEAHETALAVKKSDIPRLTKGVEDLQRRQASVENSLTTLRTKESSIETRLDAILAFIGGMTQWPGGHYALLRPRDGCPLDLAFFGGAHKFHTFHAQDSGSSHSAVLSPLTKYYTDARYLVTMELCEVTKPYYNAEAASDRPWPRGSYCIHKLISRDCPANFSQGSVLFDTEYSVAGGAGRNNIATNVHDPTLFFCCQDEGTAAERMSLPTNSPFLLYRKGGSCQAVDGMSVSDEFLTIDTDSTNKDFVDGSYPDVDLSGTSVKLFLCYYTPR